ncbi:Metal-pseudopaline receptor CntO [Methylobacterium isbiliense]|uniref:Metal-pseudopaline receptor CntO n=2 Tax=Methylobacterium isbiliense TaxID=315478 RepID=A0ABQ4SCQ2_9HYPH|nr:Metal-pseudopaline receptor CntO [Methylobacterium isbiliense]
MFSLSPQIVDPFRSGVTAALLLSTAAAMLVPLRAQAQEQAAASGGSVMALDQITVAGRGSGVNLLAPTPYTAAPTGLNLATPNRSGSRLDLSSLETPASIEIISGQKIRERGQETVQEAITQNATGITTLGAPGNGFGSYTSRGFAGVNSVMQLYDGTRLYVGAGTITYPFDTWNVDRIEVLRGPASVLYGDGAIGGIINVVPKKPTLVPVNAARAALGSDGIKRLAFDSGGPIGESLFYRLNVSGNQADGWLRQNGGFSNLAISGALLFQATPDLAFTLSHDYGYQEPLRYFGTPLIGGRIDPGTRFNNYTVDDSRIIFRDNWTQLKTEWTPSADVTLRNTAYRLTSNRRWRNAETYAFVPATGLIRRSDYVEIFHDQEQIGNRLDATVQGSLFGFRDEFVVGFDVNHIDFLHTNNSPYGGVSTVDPYVFLPGNFLRVNGTSPGYATTSDQYSLFAEDRLIVTDQLSLIAGVRYDAPTVRREDLRNPANSFTKDFSAVSYRFGAVFNPTPDTSLYASYATAVDPVNSLITLSLAQKDFELSTGEQVEVGYKQVFWGGRGEFTLAGYRIRKDNLLTVDPQRPTVAIQVGSQSSHGVEAFVSLGLWEDWRIEGNLALLHAQYDDFQQAVGGVAVNFAGKQPINVPERVANLWLSWAFAPRWEARVGVQFVGETYSDFANTVRRPSYEVVNASLDYRVTETSRFSVRVYNLLDRVYPVTGGSTYWLLGRPRSVEVAYTTAF